MHLLFKFELFVFIGSCQLLFQRDLPRASDLSVYIQEVTLSVIAGKSFCQDSQTLFSSQKKTTPSHFLTQEHIVVTYRPAAGSKTFDSFPRNNTYLHILFLEVLMNINLNYCYNSMTPKGSCSVHNGKQDINRSSNRYFILRSKK